MAVAAVWVVSGAGFGVLMLMLAKYMIKKRTGEKVEGKIITSRASIILWALFGAAGTVLILLVADSTLKILEYMGIFFTLLCLSAVDGKIRKIPNELLLFIILLKIATVIITGDWRLLLAALAGAAVGWVMFTLPARFALTIGWGDVKLAAVAGFYLGIIGLIQSVAIMGIIVVLYGLYLVATKKGNFKTEVAIGPPLSLGIFVTLLYPIATTIQI